LSASGNCRMEHITPALKFCTGFWFGNSWHTSWQLWCTNVLMVVLQGTWQFYHPSIDQCSGMRSAESGKLHVLIGYRSFAIAGPCTCNNLQVMQATSTLRQLHWAGYQYNFASTTISVYLCTRSILLGHHPTLVTLWLKQPPSVHDCDFGLAAVIDMNKMDTVKIWPTSFFVRRIRCLEVGTVCHRRCNKSHILIPPEDNLKQFFFSRLT